jgi:hypothetical protein
MYSQLASFPERTAVIARFLLLKEFFCLDIITNFSIHNRKMVEGNGPSRQRAVGRIEVKLASSSKKGGEASGMAQDISFRVKADPWRCDTLPEMVGPTERKQKRESRP